MTGEPGTIRVFGITRDTPLPKAAERYAMKGWHVFPVHTPGPEGLCTCGRVPCKTPGKHPRTPNGFKDAWDADMDQVRKWWQDWPEANIAVPSGERSRFMVLDVDLPDGPMSLIQLEEKYGPLPETRTHKSGSGCYHYFFYLQPGRRFPSGAGIIGPGLDIKAEDRYIILPPSRHASGNQYEIINDGPMVDPPEWLINLLTIPIPRLQRKLTINRNFNSLYHGLRIEQICKPINPIIRGSSIIGGHPYHGSRSGQNLHVNVDKQTWYCHRCHQGGGIGLWLVLEWAFKNGISGSCNEIIRCYLAQQNARGIAQ